MSLQYKQDQYSNLQKALIHLSDIREKNGDFVDNLNQLLSTQDTLQRICKNGELHLFMHLESETDHLPSRTNRELFCQQRLIKADQELKSIINLYQTELNTSCDRLIKLICLYLPS